MPGSAAKRGQASTTAGGYSSAYKVSNSSSSAHKATAAVDARLLGAVVRACACERLARPPAGNHEPLAFGARERAQTIETEDHSAEHAGRRGERDEGHALVRTDESVGDLERNATDDRFEV